MKICGIYQIINIRNNKIYIGQSIDIRNRFIRHKYQLNKNVHKNKKLQRSWNKYGNRSFQFQILIECDRENLKKLEKQEIEKIPENNRYNISKNYDNLYGKNNPFYGKNHTDETKKKLSLIGKTRVGPKNSNYGNKQSIETRIKTGHNKKTKLNQKQVEKIIQEKNKTHQEIAISYGVSRSVITRIKNGTRWALITNINGDLL
jgi:group I intron endonuclease